MHSSSHRTPSRLAPSFPGSLRASAKLITTSSSTALTPFTGHYRRPPPPARALPPLPEESLTRPVSFSDEFEQISYDEFRRTLLLADPSYTFPNTGQSSVLPAFMREVHLTICCQTIRVNRLLFSLVLETVSGSSLDFRSSYPGGLLNRPRFPVQTKPSAHLRCSVPNSCLLLPRLRFHRHPERGRPPIPLP